MDAAFGTGSSSGRARNLEINLVPMIDLMSCLTAFLLVTAAWQQMSAVDSAAQGHDGAQVRGEVRPTLSILVSSDGVRLGDDQGGAVETVDPHGLVAALAPHVIDDPVVEVAADAGVEYQQLIAAMDAVHAAGLSHLAIVDPRRLHTAL